MVAQQHQAYQQWLKELNFYEDEMIVFDKEIALVVTRHPDILSIIEHVEEYQQIFKKKKSQIKALQDKIIEREHLLSTIKTADDDQELAFEKLKRSHQSFVEKLEALRKNFKRFVAKNMF